MSKDNTEPIRQLCGKCGREFESADPEAEDFIFAICPACKNEEEKPKPTKRKRNRK